ncbi:arginine--tRNA ligase [bacterium]|nr:MAG: arginine--tRNA ligase [bacterium]
MFDLTEKLEKAISSAVAELYNEAVEPEITISENFEFGDLTTNIAFKLASVVRKSPGEIATEVADRIDLPDGVECAEPTDSGYVNFRYSADFLRNLLAGIIAKPMDFGRSDIGKKTKIQIEYVSANPTGPLNVVSARAAAVGSSLVNILRYAGYDTNSEYYLNDAGNQIAMLGDSFIARIRQGAGLDWEIPPEDGYFGDYIADLAAVYSDKFPQKYKILVETWEKGEIPDTEHPRKWIIGELIQQIKDDLEYINAGFDRFFSEAEFRKTGKIEKVLETLRENNTILRREDAVWFSADKYDVREEPFVLVKSDGEYTYAMVDIAYHQDKFDRGFELVYDIWGPDHHGHIGRMKAAMKALGHEGKFDILTLQQVNLLEAGKKIKMSKRTGNIVTLREIVDDVGVDVARFFFIARRMEAHLDFDLDLARKESDENPVYYIQYAHARISNILEFAKNKGIDPKSADRKELEALTEPEELLLARKLAIWPHILRKSAEEMSPHYICFYLLELARLFHPFYSKYRVVGDDKKVTMARVALCRALKEALALGLGLLGISAPENM